MAAYFIVDIDEITDPQTYEIYRRQVAAILERYGGAFVVRGGAYETIEGEWQPQRLVVLQFADTEQFRSWYHSPEYTEILRLRHQSSNARAILIQGVSDPQNE